MATIGNFVIDTIVMILTGVMDILPDSPFLEMTKDSFEWGIFGKALNIFIDIPKMITHFTLITAAFLLYYVVRMLLRWLKMIQ